MGISFAASFVGTLSPAPLKRPGEQRKGQSYN